MPHRIQLSRRRGYRKPEDAILVSRPSKWGNPFALKERVSADSPLWPYLLSVLPEHIRRMRWTSLMVTDRQTAVNAYAMWLYEQPYLMIPAREELGGRDLACWCPLVDEDGNHVPCHADVLLELVNGEVE